MAVNAQSAGSVELDFTLGPDANFLDVFGVPEPTNPPEAAPVTITDSVVYVDGAGKITGYALLSVDTASGTHSDLVGNVTGTMGNKGTAPQLKMSFSGKGSSENGDAIGKASLKWAFTGQATTTPDTFTTNVVTNTVCTTDTNCVLMPASNCVPTTGTNFVAVTNVSQITNAGAVVVTNNPIVITNFFATNVTFSAAGSNLTTSISAVQNVNHPFFAQSKTVTNLCATNTTPTCQDYTNISNVAVASTNGTETNIIVSTTSLPFTNVSTFPIQSLSSNGFGFITNSTPITNGTGQAQFLFLVTTQSFTLCTPITTNAPADVVVTTTNSYVAITNTADLGTVAGTTIFTNTAALTNGIYVATNTVSIRTNSGLPIVVSTFVTNTFTFTNAATNVVSPFRLTTTSGTNTFTNNTLVAVSNLVCTTITNCVDEPQTNVVTTPGGTVIGGTFTSFNYTSGIKGEAKVSAKNLPGTLSSDLFVANPDAAVTDTAIFLQKKANSSSTLDSRALIALDPADTSRTVLPFTGSGSVNNKGKITLTLKGTAEAKGSTLTIKGTATGTPVGGDVSIDGAAATGKILGQKIKSTVTQ